MADDIKKFAVLSNWPMSRRIAFGAVALAGLLLIGALLWQGQRGGEALLFANLQNDDAARTVEWLKSHQVNYRLEGSGSIYVKAERLYETRLSLASDGLPSGGGAGFELFDRQAFGVSDFAQKVNYQRAQQGELARTITALEPVAAARVHLALPEKRALSASQAPPSASVVLQLTPGKDLSEAQVQGVVHLLASSIPGLERDHISVVDTRGRLLSKPRRNGAAALSDDLLDLQEQVERRLEERAQSLLDHAFGVGNSQVQVTAMLNFSQVESTQELYDPESQAVRSEQAANEKNSASADSGGTSGTRAALGGGGSSGGGLNNASRVSSTTNYEISKTVRHTIDPMGQLSQISVSVLVSQRLLDGQGGQAVRKEDIETLIATALGVDAKRGDRISVVPLPLRNALEASDEQMAEPTNTPNPFYTWMPLIRYGVMGLLLLLVYFTVLRPMLRVAGQPTTMPRELEENEADERASREAVEAAAAAEAANNPARLAELARTWLKENP